jgi:hypothetical protein
MASPVTKSSAHIATIRRRESQNHRGVRPLESEPSVKGASSLIGRRSFECGRNDWSTPQVLYAFKQSGRISVSSEVSGDVELINYADLTAKFVRPKRYKKRIAANETSDFENHYLPSPRSIPEFSEGASHLFFRD